ncbi:MAG: HU family DNA-binding protein [Paludibacteraceae bacterium]|nr:HU family DNA-binding protein [Paludibacteraceae bacterium]
MAEKLSWTELRKALATRAGVSEKKAGVFLSALQTQLVEALKTEKQVKINGLGTFRVQAVAPRKSVNVTTGEEIIIDGYNKLAFTPEAGVKELIEMGASPLPSPEGKGDLIDPIQKLGAQAEEIVDILGELGQSPVKEESLEDAPLQDGAIAPTEPEPEKPEAVEPEPVQEPEPEPVKEQEPVVVPEPVFIPEPTPVVEEKPQPKPKKKRHFVRDTFICILVLLLLLGAGYWFLRKEFSNLIASFLQPKQTETEQVKENKVAVDTVAEDEVNRQKEMIPEGAISQEQILAEFMAASDEVEMPEEGKYEELITTEAIREGSRLTWMSKRYYGTKVYWPYLYDANRDVIINPSNIAVGTPIRVPKLTEAQLDTTTTAFEQLRKEAEAACRK